MRDMSTPRVLDEAPLHRAVRCNAGTPGVDWLFREQDGAETLKLYGLADADHAADDVTRRSVSFSQEFLGCHLLDQEVGRLTFVAISSGDSEFHALTLCAARLIFTKNLVEGFGFPPVEGPMAYSDSSAARGIASRKGVGKLKHILKSDVSGCNRPEDGQVKVDSVDTLLNTAVLGMKFLGAA